MYFAFKGGAEGMAASPLAQENPVERGVVCAAPVVKPGQVWMLQVFVFLLF